MKNNVFTGCIVAVAMCLGLKDAAAQRINNPYSAYDYNGGSIMVAPTEGTPVQIVLQYVEAPDTSVVEYYKDSIVITNIYADTTVVRSVRIITAAQYVELNAEMYERTGWEKPDQVEFGMVGVSKGASKEVVAPDGRVGRHARGKYECAMRLTYKENIPVKTIITYRKFTVEVNDIYTNHESYIEIGYLNDGDNELPDLPDVSM